MYFTSVIRFSPEHGRELPYYKIKESFRDMLGRVHTRVMLTPGYLPELCGDEIVQVRRGLTFLMEIESVLQRTCYKNKSDIFKFLSCT